MSGPLEPLIFGVRTIFRGLTQFARRSTLMFATDDFDIVDDPATESTKVSVRRGGSGGVSAPRMLFVNGNGSTLFDLLDDGTGGTAATPASVANLTGDATVGLAGIKPPPAALFADPLPTVSAEVTVTGWNGDFANIIRHHAGSGAFKGITCPTAADIDIDANSVVRLVYDPVSGYWQIASIYPVPT